MMKLRTIKDKKDKKDDTLPSKKSSFVAAAPQKIKKVTESKQMQKSVTFTDAELEELNQFKNATGISRNQLAQLAINNFMNNPNMDINIPFSKATNPTSLIISRDMGLYIKEVAKKRIEKEGLLVRSLMLDYIKSYK